VSAHILLICEWCGRKRQYPYEHGNTAPLVVATKTACWPSYSLCDDCEAARLLAMKQAEEAMESLLEDARGDRWRAEKAETAETPADNLRECLGCEQKVCDDPSHPGYAR